MKRASCCDTNVLSSVTSDGNDGFDTRLLHNRALVHGIPSDAAEEDGNAYCSATGNSWINSQNRAIAVYMRISNLLRNSAQLPKCYYRIIL